MFWILYKMKKYCYIWLFKYTHLYAYRHYCGRYEKSLTPPRNELLISIVRAIDIDSIQKTSDYDKSERIFSKHIKCYEYCIK